MPQDMLQAVVGNAPTVLALMYIVYRFEQRLAECHNAISQMLDRHLEAMLAHEPTDPG